MRAVRPLVCERTRAQASLQLDGELSALERRMLESHLARCPECSAFERDVTMLTHALRDAPLERPRTPVLVDTRRRVSFARVQGGVAAAVAFIALGLGVQFAGSGTDRSSTLAPYEAPLRYETSAELTREIEQVLADGRAFDERVENVGTAVPI